MGAEGWLTKRQNRLKGLGCEPHLLLFACKKPFYFQRHSGKTYLLIFFQQQLIQTHSEGILLILRSGYLQDQEILLIVTKTDDDKIKERCAYWIQQSPCWTQQDLITKEAALTSKEVDDFKKSIVNSGIKQSDTYYGPPKGERCYSYTLKIGTKEIVFCSSPEGPSEPEAFSRVVGKVTEIIGRKFTR